MSGPSDRDSRVEKLSPTKRRLFERLQQRLEQSSAGVDVERTRSVPSRSRATISPRPTGADCPLSCAQESLWFLERLSPGTAAFSVPDAMRIDGKLDAVALQSALDELCARHEVLRMRVVERDGRPYAVFDDASVEIEQARLEKGTSLEHAIEERVRRPFDL